MSQGSSIPPANAEATKPCIACKEPIRADASICKYCGSTQTPAPRSSVKKILAWVASAAAVLGLVATIYSLYSPLRDEFTSSAETKAAIRQAQAQYEQADYSAAFEAYSEILKKHPRNKPAGEGRLQAAMARVRTYSITGAEDDKSVPARAGVELTALIRVLEPAAAEGKGPRASELAAHLGWAHFLRFRIAHSDVFESAEPYLRKACALDSGNVYANEMLGNWLLQTHRGSVQEAAAHLRTGIDHSDAKNKPWARQFQLAALSDTDDPGAHRELARVANEMRKNGEALDNNLKHRVLGIFAPSVTSVAELDEALSAAPLAEMWPTYEWLADGGDTADTEWKELKGQYNLARMEELAGRPQDAFSRYERIQRHPLLAATTLAAPSKNAMARLKNKSMK
jgi:tetratricopeptide (TPR) repeat protein